eukprot:g41722.t1
MARLAIKIQRYFRRKPVRFFTFIIIYLMAGSLMFLHSGFVGDSAVMGHVTYPGDGTVNGPLGGSVGSAGLQQFAFLPFARGYREVVEKEPQPLPRRYGPPWLKPISQDSTDKLRSGEHLRSWSRALKGKMSRDQEENR